MIIIPNCCNEFCKITENPYMFKCDKCNKILPAEMIIAGRIVEEGIKMCEEYRIKKAIAKGGILYG